MHQIFENLAGTDAEFSVRVSYLELYNEELFDLLSSQEDTPRLRIFEDSAKKVSFPLDSSWLEKKLHSGLFVIDCILVAQ